MRLQVAALVVTIASTLAVARPSAWGNVGHRAVAQVAETRLNDSARATVQKLLNGKSMSDVAVWADDVRDTTHPHTAKWHYVNIPITSSGYEAAVHCKPGPEGDCVVKALARLEAVLRESGSPHRDEALRFIIHFIGDIHQPLHDGDNHDRGGGKRSISDIGGSTNLHSAWDMGIMKASGRSVASLVKAANTWLVTQDEDAIAQGDYATWAEESWRISRDVVYPQVTGDNNITHSERVEAIRIIEKRIARAGVRLASVLNRALAP